MSVVIGAFVIVGFGKEASHWPEWFGAGMAAATLAGAMTAAELRIRRL